MEEEELIARLQRQDASALEALMDRETAYACGVAGAILRHRPRDIEEVVSDAFLALWDNADKLRAGKVRAYLGRIVRNKALNRLRSLGGELPLEADALTLTPTDATSPAEALEQSERAALMETLLAALTDEDRAIFLRHYYYGQPTAEIGAALDMPAATVKTRLFRGRKKLKELLLERGYSCGSSDL